MADAAREQALIGKIRDLPVEMLTEVEDFVEFLRQRDEDRHLSRFAARLSEGVLHKIWDNPDDAEYDRLEFFRRG
jgi:hypothetical protein